MYKFEHILCPTDFSDASFEAIRFAAHASKPFDGKLTLLYVDAYEKTPPGFFLDDQEKLLQRRKDIEGFAQDRFAHILQKDELRHRIAKAFVRFGTTYKEIIDETEMGGYSAVAISTQGLACSSPHLIGRTAERVVRLCRSPVITIRPSQKESFKMISTILCPTDFSEYGNYALPYAISLARKYSAKLILLHASDLTYGNLEKLRNKFPDPSLYHEFAHEVTIEKLVGRDVEPENTIERLSFEHSADLIVMGTHGARGLKRVQIGNTTEEVIRRVPVPVLSITHPIHRTIFPRRFKDDYGNLAT